MKLGLGIRPQHWDDAHLALARQLGCESIVAWLPETLRAYAHTGYQGTIVPDHTPIVSSNAPWDTGLAYELGYIRGCLQSVVTTVVMGKNGKAPRIMLQDRAEPKSFSEKAVLP